MSKPETDWKSVAWALGERMEHHAYCESHNEQEADLKGCPFCKDRAVYRMYQEAMRSIGYTFKDLIKTNNNVSLREILRNPDKYTTPEVSE